MAAPGLLTEAGSPAPDARCGVGPAPPEAPGDATVTGAVDAARAGVGCGRPAPVREGPIAGRVTVGESIVLACGSAGNSWSRSALATWRAVGRSAGSRDRQRRQTSATAGGRFGTPASVGGAPSASATLSSSQVSAGYGTRPVNISYNSTPSE
ncbi:hypothetical protein Jiend_38930 [Micromonospora endophytica]|nr:hypothetical protein Jiend_38930 [Micromonospora endophytica]